MNKYLLLIAFSLSAHMISFADPNTVISCTTDEDCPQANCHAEHDYQAPKAFCKKINLFGRPTGFCACRYEPKPSGGKNGPANAPTKKEVPMPITVIGCPDSSCDRAACISGAKPQCDAAHDGVCYCPF